MLATERKEWETRRAKPKPTRAVVVCEKRCTAAKCKTTND